MFSTTGPHADGGVKDSLHNARETREFVFNLATWSLREAVNLTSTPAPRDIDELELAGLTMTPGRLVRPPLVAESPVHLECTLVEIVELRSPDRAEYVNTVVFGEVVGVHVSDSAIVDGRVDVRALDPIARLGYDQYTRVVEVFSMTRPGWPPTGR